MIDEDFLPSRLELALLGELLVRAQQYPLSPSLQVDDLYERIDPSISDFDRALFDDHIEQMEEVGLIAIQDRGMEAGRLLGRRPIDVRLTVGGAYFCVSHAYHFSEQKHGLTADMPDEYSDLTFAIARRFGPAVEEFTPAASDIVDFSGKEGAISGLEQKIDKIIELLASDNEIGAKSPLLRDEKIRKLRELKEGLSDPEARVSYLMFLGIQTLFWVASVFAEKPLGILSDEAWSALKYLIGV